MDTGTSIYDYLYAQYKNSLENNLWNMQINPAFDTWFNNIPLFKMPESTDQNSINVQNKNFLDFLRSKESFFITLLHRSDFEDGMTNDAIIFIQQNIEANKSVTCNWLNEIYGKYLKDKLALCGILRILAFLRITDYESTFMPMIIASLKDDSTECQESALMLIEVIRSKECLDAIESTTFSSDWIKEYADSIVSELREELQNNVNQKNQVNRVLGS